MVHVADFSYGSEDNDIEPELEAIPESPKTSSSHQSFCVSYQSGLVI